MLKHMLFVGAILLVWSAAANGQTYGKFGAGFIAGDPTGVSMKYRYSHENAVEGAVGFLPDNAVRVNMSYLWHTHPFSNDRFGMDFGPGVAFGPGRTEESSRYTGPLNRGEQIGFGLRGIAEMNYAIPKAPLDLFVQGAPLLIVSPNTMTGLDIGFGMRAYF